MMYGPWGHGVFWGGGGLMMLLVIAAAVVLVVLVVKLLSPSAAVTTGHGGTAAQAGPAMPAAQPGAYPPPGPAAETPRDIVQRRYASGEIDRDEYLQKLADL